MKKIKYSILGLGLISSLGFAAQPEWSETEVVAHAGPACPQGSTVKVTNPENSNLINVAIPNIVVRSNDRVNCTISLNVAHPAGWQYAVKGFDTWVYSDLPANASAEIKSYSYFQGETEETVFTHQWGGRYKAHFEIHKDVANANLNYSPCGGGRSLNTNTAAKISGGGLAKIKQKLNFRLVWRRC